MSLTRVHLILPALALFVACASGAGEGEACEQDNDCADGLHCHIEDGGGVCEANHDDDEHDDDTGEHDDDTGEHHDDTGAE